MGKYVKLGILLLVLASSCQTVEKNQISPVRKSEFKELTTNSQLMKFLKVAGSTSDYIQIDTLGVINNEYNLPAVKISSKKGNAKKVKVLIMAQQHGDEPSGKEAVLELIADFSNGQNTHLLNNIELYILPQLNPWGGDHDERRNADSADLNRNHLLLSEKEVALTHNYFHEILPHVSIDIHEYDPYYEEWTNFGYYKNADVQLGGPTNPSVKKSISRLFSDELVPQVKSEVEKGGYSFLQYTLGQIYNEQGKLRHSTVHIDDGRQSFGINQTFSMIIEGKYGKNSIENLKYRTESQLYILKSIINFVDTNAEKIQNIVDDERKQLVQNGLTGYMGVRFTHVKNGQKLLYPLWSIQHQKDTLFLVNEYYPKTIVTDSVKVPEAYLVSKNDTTLRSWMERNHIHYEDFTTTLSEKIIFSEIIKTDRTKCFEGWSFTDLTVNEYVQDFVPNQYVKVPLNQLSASKIVLAFEPTSMLGLFNESSFSYLINSKNYPILKIVSK